MAKRRPSGDGMVRLKKENQWEGRITVYEYDDWNYDYFPNRPGAKFFKDKK